MVVTPPPSTGMTIATEGMLREIARRGLRVSTTSVSSHGQRGLRWRLTKGWSLALGSISATSSQPRPLYIVADSRYGLLLTLIVCVLARLRRHPLILHHHVYRYVHQQSSLMSFIVGWSHPDTIHVMLCDEMANRFRGRYPAARTAVVNNAALLQPLLGSPPNRMPGKRLRIGMIGALTVEKGVDTAFDLAARCANGGLDVELVLAGNPARIPERPKGEAVNCDRRGFVHGPTKSQFFSDIDLLVLPTRYANEAQPLVILEALRQGTRVLASPLGCIASLAANMPKAVIPISDWDGLTPEGLSHLADYDGDDIAGDWSELLIRSHAQIDDLCSAIGALGRDS